MKNLKSDFLSRFDGYHRGDESRRKLTENVFSPGDSAFMSGDLIKFDDQGWCYFVERLGDCYRWKDRD